MGKTVDPALPRGWSWSSVQELASYVQRGKSPRYTDRSDFPVVNQKCVRWDGVDATYIKFIDASQGASWGPERTLLPGDILWNSTGVGTVGRAAVFRGLDGFSRVVADSHITVIRLADSLPEYVHAWIRSPMGQRRIEAMQAGSTSQVELPRSEILQTEVPVAPRDEQCRIVAKLGALQKRRTRVVRALDAIAPMLERLRQSLYTAAFRGDLTRDWRANNRVVEPARELLERVLGRRDEAWSKRPPNDSGLPELPTGWCWATLADLSWNCGYGTSTQCDYRAPGVPVLRIPNIVGGRVDLSDLKRALASPREDKRLLAPGDLLVVRTNGSRGLLGRGAVVLEALPEPFSFASYLIRFRLVPHEWAWAWVGSYWQSPLARVQVNRDAASSAGQYNIGLAELSSCGVPIAPEAEQTVILERLSARIDASVRIETIVADQREQLENIERAMLLKAFRGDLVEPDRLRLQPDARLP